MLTVAMTTYEFEQKPEPMWVCIDATRITMVCGPSPIQNNVQTHMNETFLPQRPEPRLLALSARSCIQLSTMIETHPIGLSKPSGMRCASTAPIP